MIAYAMEKVGPYFALTIVSACSISSDYIDIKPVWFIRFWQFNDCGFFHKSLSRDSIVTNMVLVIHSTWTNTKRLIKAFKYVHIFNGV